jgi:hypothetical protein
LCGDRMMPMDLDHAKAIIVRLCASGPLLFIGVLMLIDPAFFAISVKPWRVNCGPLSIDFADSSIESGSRSQR